jgi:TetR/AcrR family transcriptional regulator, transcriptional repressor for nem operon
MTQAPPSAQTPRPNKFAQRREATRANLLRLGIERFARKGYSGTTVEDIVRDSPFTRGAFYFHFTGKEDFFLAVLRERARIRPEWWKAARDPAVGDLRQTLVAVLQALAETEEIGGHYLLLTVDFFQTVRAQAVYADALSSLYLEWIDELGRLVDELRSRDLIRTDLATASLAAEVFAVADGYTVHTTLYGADPSGLIDALVRVLQP